MTKRPWGFKYVFYRLSVIGIQTRSLIQAKGSGMWWKALREIMESNCFPPSIPIFQSLFLSIPGESINTHFDRNLEFRPFSSFYANDFMVCEHSYLLIKPFNHILRWIDSKTWIKGYLLVESHREGSNSAAKVLLINSKLCRYKNVILLCYPVSSRNHIPNLLGA